MGNLVAFAHISLDGFAADPKGGLGWVTVNDELFDHVGQRIQATDTSMYGRTTYELMEGYWPNAGDNPSATKHEREHSRWYNQTHKVILSTTLKTSLPNTTIVHDNILSNVRSIKNQSKNEILLFGSPSATHELLRLDLVDEFWLFVNPVVLGQGLSLFGQSTTKKSLTLLSTKQFSFGVTELKYRMNRQQQP